MIQTKEAMEKYEESLIPERVFKGKSIEVYNLAQKKFGGHAGYAFKPAGGTKIEWSDRVIEEAKEIIETSKTMKELSERACNFCIEHTKGQVPLFFI